MILFLLLVANKIKTRKNLANYQTRQKNHATIVLENPIEANECLPKKVQN